MEAVRGRNVEVYMDGGVRAGTDVLKALARGAKAVFVGRPALWGLACSVSLRIRTYFYSILLLDTYKNRLLFLMVYYLWFV